MSSPNHTTPANSTLCLSLIAAPTPAALARGYDPATVTNAAGLPLGHILQTCHHHHLLSETTTKGGAMDEIVHANSGAFAHEAAVHRLMACTAAGNDGNLALGSTAFFGTGSIKCCKH